MKKFKRLKFCENFILKLNLKALQLFSVLSLKNSIDF